MVKAVFRVDSSTIFATGHVMRCLNIADQLKKLKNIDSYFVCREHHGHISEIIKNKGYGLLLLPLREPDFDRCASFKKIDKFDQNLGSSIRADALDFNEYCKKIKADIAIIDHYFIDYSWQNLIKNNVKKIVVIDDLANRNHLSDILIDTNIKRTETDYKALVPEKSKIFCGTEYFFLRPEFYTIQKLDIMNCNVAKQLKKILISFGGVDRDNFTLKTINALSKLHFSNNLSITVIVGKSYMWLKELKKYQNDTNMNFSLIVQSDKMALLMHDNDLMIGAGGTTNCEAMSLGLPSLLVCTADNQKRTVGIMNDCKYAIKVENNESFACEIKDKLEVLWKKPQILNEMRKNCNDVLVGSQKHINELLDQITKNI